MEQITISYHGHACFALEAKGYRAVIDPYGPNMIPGLPELKLEAEAVYCSHDHGDHNYSDAVNQIDSAQWAPYTVEEIITPHDDQGGSLRGFNVVRIFHFGDISVAHLGDIGVFPDEELLNKLKNVDCMMIPVGGFFTIDADTAAKIVEASQPKVCIPMHYRTDTVGFEMLGHINDFIDRFENVNKAENHVVLNKETDKQILFLEYKP